MPGLLRQPGGFEGFGLGRTVAPPDALSVSPSDRLPERIDDRRVARGAMAPTANVSERHISEVAQLLDLGGVVGEGTEEVVHQRRRPSWPW